MSGQQQQRSFIIVYVQSGRENSRTRRRRERQHAQDADKIEKNKKQNKVERKITCIFLLDFRVEKFVDNIKSLGENEVTIELFQSDTQILIRPAPPMPLLTKSP